LHVIRISLWLENFSLLLLRIEYNVYEQVMLRQFVIRVLKGALLYKKLKNVFSEFLNCLVWADKFQKVKKKIFFFKT